MAAVVERWGHETIVAEGCADAIHGTDNEEALGQLKAWMQEAVKDLWMKHDGSEADKSNHRTLSLGLVARPGGTKRRERKQENTLGQ